MIPQYMTFSEFNYLPLGLTLYDSLCKHSKSDFVLHYIVYDSKSYDILTAINNKNLKVYLYEDCKKAHSDFELLEKNFSKEMDGQSKFHWMMTPVSVNFLLKQGLEHCVYIDADICFYNDPKLIIDAVHGKSVGLCTHKHMPLRKNVRDVGYYNVGVIYFNNNDIGKRCAQWWSDVCVDPHNKWAHGFGFCGDQKYLEVFEDIIGPENIEIIDYDIGHVAPWNVTYIDFLANDKIIWRDTRHHVLKDCASKHQDLVYAHFSHFKPNLENNSYIVQREGEWGPILDHPGVKDLYDRYLRDVTEVCKKYSL